MPKSDVQPEEHWTKGHLCKQDKLSLECFLKARILVGLESLADIIGEHTDQDLKIVHRRNEKGAWKDELWTLKAFEPYELRLAPVSSQLKTTHLHSQQHAVVSVPRHGPGAHPEGPSKMLALDGRSRTLVGKEGSVHGHEKSGGLFWLVGRTSDRKLANLEFESIHFKMNMEFIGVPAAKKQKVDNKPSWKSEDLPAIPILTNKVRIEKHTKLLAYQKEP